jgi:hypothetical protein
MVPGNVGQGGMGDGLVYIWRPVGGGRHAFPAWARKIPHDETVTAYCGAKTEAAALHSATELDWICEPSCMECWRVLASPN